MHVLRWACLITPSQGRRSTKDTHWYWQPAFGLWQTFKRQRHARQQSGADRCWTVASDVVKVILDYWATDVVGSRKVGFVVSSWSETPLVILTLVPGQHYDLWRPRASLARVWHLRRLVQLPDARLVVAPDLISFGPNGYLTVALGTNHVQAPQLLAALKASDCLSVST